MIRGKRRKRGMDYSKTNYILNTIFKEENRKGEGHPYFYDNLRIAIIRQACVDYQRSNEKERERIEKFLLSSYGQWLSWDQGAYIIDKLHEPSIAEKTRRVRIYLGMNQSDFGKLLGTKIGIVCKMETGGINVAYHAKYIERVEKYYAEMKRKEGAANG